MNPLYEKYKAHLTKAQAQQLARLTERYKQIMAQKRADSYNQLHSQSSSALRGLQNMGLAGRKGNLVSGGQKAADISAQEAQRDYNQAVTAASMGYAEQAAARMANATRRAEYVAEVAEQQKKATADAEKYRKEYESALARQRAAEAQYRKMLEERAKQEAERERTAPAIREMAAMKQAAQNGRPALWNQRETDSGAALGITYDPYAHKTAENIRYYQSEAQKNGLKGADANRYAVQKAADIANRQGAAANAITTEQQRRSSENIDAIMKRPEYRFSAEYGVDMQKVRREDPDGAADMTKRITAAYNDIDKKTSAWEKAIAHGERAMSVKENFQGKSEAVKNMQTARKEMAAAYATLGRMQVAATQPVEYRDLYMMTDEEFDVAYDAAKKLYEDASQGRVIAGYHAAPSEADIKTQTERFTKYEQARLVREMTTEKAYKYNLVPVESKEKHVKDGMQDRKVDYYPINNKYEGKSYVLGNGRRREPENGKILPYDEEHGTENSLYAAIINEYSPTLDYNEKASRYTASGKLDSNSPGFSRMVQILEEKKAGIVNPEKSLAGKQQKMISVLVSASYMTEEEVARYNTILDKYGAKEADEYFEYLYDTVLPIRVNQAIDEDYDAMLRRETVYDENGNRIGAKDGKDTWLAQLASSVLSVPLNIVEGITNPLNTLMTRQQDSVAARFSARRNSGAQETRNAVQENFSETGKFFYGTGMSMADSAVVAAISGGIGKSLSGIGVPAKTATKIGSVLGGSLLGGSAYNSAYSEALQRGLTPDKARLTAVGQGINEMLFESLSLDMLVGHYAKGGLLKVSKKAGVNWIVNTLVQGGVEGSEEFFTDIANRIWDNQVNGIFSEELTQIRKYISEGMSYEDAKAQVNREFAAQLALSFAGGAISGGVMGGGATFMGMVQNRTNEKLGKGLQQNQRVMDELRDFDYKSEYAQEILKQKNLTNADIADLFNIRQQELIGQYKSDIQKAVADGKITQEQADLLKQYEQNGVQIVKDGKVVDNADGITVDQMPTVQDAIASLDNAARIQFLDNEEMRSLVQAVGGETAAVIEQSGTTLREAEKAYQQTVREINNDTTLSPEQKQKRLEAAERTRQNARSEASKIADTALENKKGIGAKLETDGNGTVKVGKGSGKVTYDFSTKGNPGHQSVESMTATEQSALRIAKIVAASRPDVNVKVEAEFGVDENGIDHSKENGYYDRSTNTIHINMSGDNSVLWTLSHELTHHLANTDTAAYAALRNAIETALKDSKLTTTELEERGFEYDLDRVDPYIAREGNLWDALVAFEREEHGYGKDAEEEVVARCCESFLGFDQFVKDFAHKQYKSAKAINKFIAQMNIDVQRVSEEARQSAAQRNVWNDESPENQILRQLTEIDKIANLWRIAVNAEAKKRQTAREETRASTMDSVKLSDTEYLDLARRYESGDKSVEAELRKAVDAAAKAAGYTITAYHGTAAQFNVFNRSQAGKHGDNLGPGYYFAADKAFAREYARSSYVPGENTTRVIDSYLKIEKPASTEKVTITKEQWHDFLQYVLDHHSEYIDDVWQGNFTDESIFTFDQDWESENNSYGNDKDLFLSFAHAYAAGNPTVTEAAYRMLKESTGYDGIIYEPFYKSSEKDNVYVVFTNTQMKQSDLVTYDNDGNIIPLSERFKTDRTGEDAWKNEDIRFSMKDNVERKGDLIAVHNLSGDQLLRSIELGGFPMPSIAVMKQSQGHDRYGDVSVIFNKDTIDPKKSTANKVYGGDAWTPTYPTIEYKPNEKVLEKISDKYYDLRKRFGYDAARPLYKYAETMDDVLNREGGEAAVLDRLYDDDRMMQLYQKDEGVDGVDQKSYRAWVDGLFKGIEEKRGIRNSKEYITPSGKRRSFEELHYEETLENVVKSMLQNRNKNIMGSDIWGIAAKRYKSLSEVKKDESRLQHQSPIAYDQARKGYMMKFYDIVDRIYVKSDSNYFIASDIAAENLIDSLRYGGNSKESMLRYLQKYHPRATMSVVDDFVELVKEISEMPTEYFEAKPERAVGIDEIKAVIMPQGKYAELKEKLGERGIPVIEYDKNADTDSIGNNVDRLRALNSDAVSAQRFSKMDKVRLSTVDGTRTYTSDGVTAKLYGNDVELDGGKVRQRVQMMEAIAEVNGTARVDAASEEEAEAFRRAGAEQVVEELEGHGAKYGTWEFKYEERKFTNDSRYDIKQKQKFAKDILKQVGKSSGFTQAQRVKYGAALGRLMDYLWEMQYGKMDGKVIFEFADRLFDSIMNDYTALSEADEEFRSELLSNMTKTKNAKGSTVYVLEVNDKQMREIKYAYENAMAYASKLSKALGVRVTVKQTENAKTLEDIFTNSTDTRIKSDTNEGDMPGELLRLAQETESRKTNPYAAESEERQALKEGMFYAAMDAAGVEKSTAQQIREAVKETRKAERTKAKTEARKAIDNARLAERIHEGALRAKDRRISENRERALKQHAAEREAKLKQGFRETTQKANETRMKRDMRTIALKWNQRLVKLLANQTEASHVPVQLAREVAELTKTITEYLDSGTERGRINLEKVIKAYQRSFADEETIAKAKAEDPHFDPRGLLQLHYDLNGNVIKEDPLLDMMNELNEIVAAKSFKDLSAYEMKALLDIVRGVAHTVYDANRMIGTSERRAIWEVGDAMIHQFEDAHDVKLKGYLETSLDFRRLARIISGSNDNAEFVKLVERLNDGAIEKERIAQVLQDIFAPVTEKYGDEIRKWYGKKAEWIDTGITQNGKKVEITKGMRVSLAMHVLNAGNMNHIANGGITIPNREMYNKGRMTDAYANGETVQLSAEQIEEIISHMTEAEKAYVEAAKEFFHKRTGYYVNKTSLQLLGYRKATVENYFPIHTDKNFTKTDFASLQMDGSIEGQGFLKERVNASNPVYLEDITSVVNRQIRGVALYAGLAVPMRNFNAVMNSTEYFEDENGAWRPRTTVRKAMTQKMGEYGAKVVKGFLEDASEMTHVDVTPMERFAGKLATNYVKAVLLGNLKVAMKQVASYPTAAAVIPWKYLGKALLKGGRNHRLISRADVDLINQYTPLYRMRREGNANEIASIMAKRGMEQKLPWLLGWITKFDVATVGRLWSAAEYMVADQQKNLPVGSDEYYKAVAKVFNDTIQQTQPNFTPLQRNAALRSKNPVVRSLVLFGTQRMQNGGILMEAAMELKQSKGKSKAEIKAAKMKLGRAVASQIVQNILLIVASLGVDALRGRMKGWQDEDKDITPESMMKGMGDMFLSNFIGSFLGGSETYSLISGLFKKAMGETAYDTEFTVPALDAIETLINFAQSDVPSTIKYLLGDHTDEEKRKKAISFSYQLAKAFGYATGIPLENAVKDLFKGIIPAINDHVDYFKTGEFPQWWLHQSGKLDSAKTAANYKEWTNLGKKGSVYLAWENRFKEDTSNGLAHRAELLFEDRGLTADEKAILLRMSNSTADNPLTSKDGVVYKEDGTVAVDFTSLDRYRASTMLSDKQYEGFLNLVDMGVAEDVASTAFIQYNAQKKQGSGANDRFRDWLFKTVKNPEDRAKVDMAVVGNTVRVEGTVGYKENGEVYADYSSKDIFDLYTNGKKQDKSDAIISTTDTPEAKAKAFADTDNSYHAKGGIVYNDKDKVVADFTSEEAYRASQMGETHYEKYNDAVKYGMRKENAILAVEKHKEFTNDDDKDNASQYASWIFKNLKNPKDRAIAGAIYTTKPVTVKDGRTYDENGYIYRDYTSAAWYKLSNRKLSSDGVNKRYEAAKLLEKDGYTAEKTVEAYVELDKLSKKSEWQNWLKDHGYTNDQIKIILWSRGWAKLK